MTTTGHESRLAASGEPPLVAGARRHGSAVAIVDGEGATTYEGLLETSGRVAGALLAGREDLEEARIGVLVAPGGSHVAVQWGVWRAGGVVVPLAVSHPPAELERVLGDARTAAVVAGKDLRGRVDPVCRRLGIELQDAGDHMRAEAPERFPELCPERRALMVYTSGTTGVPKGVVTTHGIVAAQVGTLVRAWGWRTEDRILHVLPLHHVHGLVNGLCCALWAGATCEMAPFEPGDVWERFASGEITLFMAVPTIYRRLITHWERAPAAARRRYSAGARQARLMVSGSAALPVRTLERWQEITGQRLLERYGMTEIGMALSNPLEGERRAGTVGVPLPGVQARVVGPDGADLPAGGEGEIEIRGPQVFLEYWRRPAETREAFREGWFRTGDVGVVEDGYWRILGRKSVDIIKTGGYKVSALEIEEVLRGHPAILDAAVVGVADPDWGERVCAAVIADGDADVDVDDLRAWCRARLAPYKVPKEVLVTEDLPRNAMGKVIKPALRERFGG